MGLLGDSFPEEFRENFSNRNLEVGSVIRCMVHDTRPPKIKFFIIVGITDDDIALGTVYINSEINSFIQRTPARLNAQVMIEAERTDFLSHDSFVDCSQIYKKPKQEIAAILQENADAYVGELSMTDLIEVNQAIQNAPTIPKVVKRMFGIIQ